MTEPTREQLDNLLDHAHKRRLGPDEVGRIRDGIANLRQQLALSQAGASQRETLLTEARDALEEHGGHGDAWPDIAAPILTLGDRLEQAEAAVQRVRDMHRPWTTFYGTHCRACSRLGVVGHTMTGSVIDMPCPTLQALDVEAEPAAGNDTEPDPPKMPVGEFMRRLAEAFGKGHAASDDAERMALMKAILTRESEATSASVYFEPEPAAWDGISPESLLTTVDEAVPAADISRAGVLREAIDVAREEANRLETQGNLDHSRGARCVAYLLRRRLAKEPAAPLTDQPKEQA